MRGAQVAAFATAHKLAALSVADLIAWRQRSERLVERIGSFPIETRAGPATAFTYRSRFDPMHHLALVFGDIGDGRNVTVRLQIEDVAEHVFGAQQRLDAVMARIAEEGRGVIVYLREGAVGVTRTDPRARESAQAESTQAQSLQTDEAHASAEARDAEWREIGLGAQILKDLGVASIRLIASRERRYVGIGGFGIEIEATEILEA
jgi:3,4-dihydroxy 2-butanone 4-phosphate synthase/GTP cyclohydrolase II